MTAVDGIDQIIRVFSPPFGKLLIVIESLPGRLYAQVASREKLVKLTIDP